MSFEEVRHGMKTRAERSMGDREPMRPAWGKFFHIPAEDAVLKLQDMAKGRLAFQGTQNIVHPSSQSKVANLADFLCVRQKCK